MVAARTQELHEMVQELSVPVISTAVSTKIVESGHNMSGILSFSTLQHGIYFALAQMDMKILKQK